MEKQTEQQQTTNKELEGQITMWHSFTQSSFKVNSKICWRIHEESKN